jgi:hypothetical protein
VGAIFVASLACVPILIAGKHLLENLLIRGVIFGTLYLAAYILLLRLLGVSEVRGILEKIAIGGRAK